MSTGLLDSGGSINESIPSTGLFGWQRRGRYLIDIGMSVIGMPDDDPGFESTKEGDFVDLEASGRLLPRQKATVSESIESRSELICFGNIRDS